MVVISSSPIAFSHLELAVEYYILNVYFEEAFEDALSLRSLGER